MSRHSAPRRDTLAGRLARSLTYGVGSIWLACVLGVVWYVDSEIDHNFDNELAEVSHRLFDLALQHLDQQQGQAPGQPQGAPAPLLIPPPATFAASEVPYQLISTEARVLARSTNASAAQFDVPLASGFAEANAWRVYTVKHPQREIFLQVADPLHERRAAVNRTLIGLILPLVAVLPLLAWLLRRIARRELQVLEQLTREISQRDGQLLQPIALPGLPRELRRVEDHVNRLLQRLSHALNVERALAANAAHELRTPLAAARLRLQTALDHHLGRSDVQAALDALQTLSQRTEKLLQLSRAESSAPLAREPIDLAQLAHTVAQEFWQQDSAIDQLELLVPQPPGSANTVGDFDALAIALRNLVENALRYSQGEQVEIIVGPGTCLSVRDQGPGLPSTQLAPLQQRHMRHPASRVDDKSYKGVGYGLGLSIVATIAQKHGAQLTLTSPLQGQQRGFEARLELPPAEAFNARPH